jgi:hypothetical protein
MHLIEMAQHVRRGGIEIISAAALVAPSQPEASGVQS